MHEKRDEDEARLKRIEEEKKVVERRLHSVHQRYVRFNQRSRAALAEMEKLRDAALRDGLTNAFNRKAYDHQIAKALEELSTGRLSRFCLIVFDVDHFKDFNTNYGHRAGDKVLINVVRLVRNFLRRDDFLARYGGDEFVIILPEVNLIGAVRIASQIKNGVGGVDFKIYRDHDLTVRVSLSMGVGLGRGSDNPGSIFQRADQALYRAKERGRNQVCAETDLS